MHTATNRFRSWRKARFHCLGSLPFTVLGLVEAIDRLLEGLALDEPHGVEGAALGVASQAVDRNHARVLEASGDLGLEQEAGAAVRVVGAFGSELLERDLAIQLGVEGHGDLAKAPLGMRPEDAEP